MKNKILNKWLLSAAALIPGIAVGALPTIQNNNAQTGDYLGLVEELFGKAYDTGSLMIGAGVFLVVVLAIIIAFWEYHKGRKELSDVGVVAAAGGLVMTVVIILLQNGANVL